MIVRLVLAVVVAAALLGAALPVVEDARHDLATTTADRSVQSVADAITDVRRSSDPVPRGVPGASRVVAVDVPADGTVLLGATTIGGATTDVGATTNASGSGANAGGTATDRPPVDGPSDDVISARVSQRAAGRERVGVDVRIVEDGRVRPDEEGLAVRESGRVVLRYVLVDGEPTVTVASV